MPSRGPMSRAVADAVKSAQIPPTDSGAVALAKRYAVLIDEAAPTARYAELLRALGAGLAPDDDRAQDAFRKVADALGQHSVASDLGPKLLAALTALGLTATGRGVKGGGQGGAPIASRLDEFTAARARKRPA